MEFLARSFEERLGRKIWTCVQCGKEDIWVPTWLWYGSAKDLDDSKPVVVVCSEACRKACKRFPDNAERLAEF